MTISKSQLSFKPYISWPNNTLNIFFLNKENRISLLSYVLGQYKPKPPVLSSEILCLGTKLCSYELILGPYIEQYNIHIIFSGKIKYIFSQMQFKKKLF